GHDPENSAHSLLEGTSYTYSGEGEGKPVGLVLAQYNVTAVLSDDGTIGSLAAFGPSTKTYTYYDSTDVSPSHLIAGAWWGRPKFTVDAAGQETYFAYDSAGRTILNYVYKTWTDPSTGDPVSGWVGTTSAYNALGQLTDQYQATYTDNGTDS